MPLPTKNLTDHLKRESATLNLLDLLANLYINYKDNRFSTHGRIMLQSSNNVARFVRRMSKIDT